MDRFTRHRCFGRWADAGAWRHIAAGVRTRRLSLLLALGLALLPAARPRAAGASQAAAAPAQEEQHKVVYPARPAPLEEAWHPGKPELDLGQGLIYRLAPEWTEEAGRKGVNLFGWWMISLQTSSGGVKDSTDLAGLFDFGVDLDMERLAGADGMLIHVSGSWAAGSDLTNDLGSFTPANAVFSGDSLRFFEAYIEQAWMDDTLTLRAGRLAIGWEYGLEYDLFTQYLSAGYRLNVFALDANSPNFSVIPFANWGARIRWTPNDKWRLQASFMNGYPRDFADDDKHGLDLAFHPDEGSFFIGEGTYQWLGTRERRRAQPGRLPGRVTFGAYYDTGDYELLADPLATASGLHSIYVILRQKVWEPSPVSDRGIDLWTSLASSGKEEIVPVTEFWSGGLVWTGPSSRRPLDTLALGFARSGFSDALRPATHETVLEASYSFNTLSWLSIMLDLQYVVRPGGTGAVDDALVPGVLAYITF